MNQQDVLPRSLTKELVTEWRKGESANPKISQFLILNQRQQQELKSALIKQRKSWPYSIPAIIPGKMLHGYQSRVQNGGFTDQEFLDWIERAGDDSAEINLDSKCRIGIEAVYSDSGRNMDYPVRLTIHSDAFGQVWSDSVIPVGLRDPKSRPRKRRKKGKKNPR